MRPKVFEIEAKITSHPNRQLHQSHQTMKHKYLLENTIWSTSMDPFFPTKNFITKIPKPFGGGAARIWKKEGTVFLGPKKLGSEARGLVSWRGPKFGDTWNFMIHHLLLVTQTGPQRVSEDHEWSAIIRQNHWPIDIKIMNRISTKHLPSWEHTPAKTQLKMSFLYQRWDRLVSESRVKKILKANMNKTSFRKLLRNQTGSKPPEPIFSPKNPPKLCPGIRNVGFNQQPGTSVEFKRFQEIGTLLLQPHLPNCSICWPSSFFVSLSDFERRHPNAGFIHMFFSWC